MGVFAADLLWYCFSEPTNLNPRDLWSPFCCWRRLGWLLCFSPGVLGWCRCPCQAEGAPPEHRRKDDGEGKAGIL